MVRLTRPACMLLIVLFFSSKVPLTKSQESGRIKVAEGEYQVTVEGDLGIGPIETEIFHFRESWILWRTTAGEYVLEGKRMFESDGQSSRGPVHREVNACLRTARSGGVRTLAIQTAVRSPALRLPFPTIAV